MADYALWEVFPGKKEFYAENLGPTRKVHIKLAEFPKRNLSARRHERKATLEQLEYRTFEGLVFVADSQWFGTFLVDSFKLFSYLY